MTEAGWYADRDDPAKARWHDGQDWTGHRVNMADHAGPPPPPVDPEPATWTQPPQPVRPPAPVYEYSPAPIPPQQAQAPGRFAGRPTSQLVVVGAAVVIGISCFLPWVKVVLIGTITASGTDASSGDGWFFLGGAFLLGLVAWLRPLRVPALLLSVAGVIGFVYERHHIGTSKQIPISIGFGLWLILLASVIAAAVTISEITEGSRPPAAVDVLPVPARRFWWGILIAVALLAGAVVYGQEHHDADFGFDPTASSGLEASGSVATTVDARPPKVEVAEVGSSTYTSDYADKPQGTAGAVIKNPGTKTVAFVTVVFTFKDASGKAVGTETAYVDAVPAGGEAYSEVDGVDLTAPATSVEANAVDENASYKGVSIPVSNISVAKDGDEYSGQEVNGTAANPTSKVIEGAGVDCIGRLGGRIVGGVSTSLDALAPGASVAWTTQFEHGLMVDSVQCSAGQSA